MHYDIIIVGGGIVGTTLALALAEQQPHLSLAILETKQQPAKWSAAHAYPRVSALSLSSQRIFQALGVWNAIAEKRLSPFSAIQVWDAAHKGEISFTAADIGEPVLGFIVENNLIQSVLMEQIKKYPAINYFAPVDLLQLEEDSNRITLLSKEHTFTAELVVGADGAHSWLRQAAHIPVNKKLYGQEAIVATLTTALPHQQIARQIFLESGPLAFLPLAATHEVSIVWTVAEKTAESLLALDESAFKQQLEQASSGCLGSIEKISERHAFPLSRSLAKNYVKPRIALVGDAAHVVHPLAGQGLNIGLLDAAALCEILMQARDAHRPYADPRVLRRYERWRKADNAAWVLGIESIKTLFSYSASSMQPLCSLGLNLVNRLQWIKNKLMIMALGNRADLPALACKDRSSE
jgi:2-polyprenylphenol 6-hydroxylase